MVAFDSGSPTQPPKIQGSSLSLNKRKGSEGGGGNKFVW